MRKKKELSPVEEVQAVTQEVQEIIEPVEKEIKEEVKEKKPQVNKPQISDVEVARKLVNIHSSAQSRGLEFNLTFEYVKKLLEYTTCFYTNATFTEDGPNQRTFDRVDNEKGYVIGNVVACTTDINGKKNNLTIDEIICLYKKLGHLKGK
jgi:acetyl-CoA carboxylase alpha subunit